MRQAGAGQSSGTTLCQRRTALYQRGAVGAVAGWACFPRMPAPDILLLASTMLTPSAQLWTSDKRLLALAVRFNRAYQSELH